MELETSWREALADELDQPYYRQLMTFVDEAYATQIVYPPRDRIFHAFARTPLPRVRVVVLGQDPYHGPGQAQGLAFYVPPGIDAPPSLVNIAREVGHTPDLLSWADQGVLLLNAILTVSETAGSHQGRGWERFTDAVVRVLNRRCEHLVFLLWGAYAQKKGAKIDRTRHLVLEAPHPSPLSAYRGFFGCGHFQACNAYLAAHGKMPISW